MSDSIFDKIVRKEIPAHIIYEDNHTLAFLDINPLSKGHTLVIPKVHAQVLSELNDEVIGNVFVAVKRVMERIDQTLHPDGYNVGWNHHEAGGQAVPYLHVHVIPRWREDGGGNMHSIISNPGDMSVEDVAKLFQS